MDDCYFIDPGCSLESAERTSTQVTRKANRKKRLTVLYIVEHPNQEGDTCIDWTSQYCWTNGWNCLWRGHSVYRNRPLIPLSFGCDSTGYYPGAHGTALIPTDTQFPCRTGMSGRAPDACLAVPGSNPVLAAATMPPRSATTPGRSIAQGGVGCGGLPGPPSVCPSPSGAAATSTLHRPVCQQPTFLGLPHRSISLSSCTYP